MYVMCAHKEINNGSKKGENKSLSHLQKQRMRPSQRWSDRRKKKTKTQQLASIRKSLSLSQEELREAMKKLNDTALVLTSKAIDADARNSNFVFSPASISAALTMMAVTNGTHSDELNAVYQEIATVVLADDSASGGPKISSVNGVWVEQSLPVDHL